MFLSIIVPVYNCSAFLYDALVRLSQLQKNDIEIIVIDDGSSDDSFSICQKYCSQHERMTAITQKRAGPSAARNRGLKLAKGDYIAFFDADDIVDETAFLRLLEPVKKHPEIDVWCTDFYRIDTFGRICDRVAQIREQSEPIFDADYLPDFMGAADRYWNIWRYVFKRSFLLKNDLFYLEGYNIAEDLEYMTRVFLQDARFAFFHNPYYYYVVEQKGTLTGQYDVHRITQLLDMLTVSGAALDGAPEHSGVKEMARKIRLEYVMCLALICETPHEQRREAKAAFRNSLSILDKSDQMPIRIILAACRKIGIGPVAWLLYLIKRIRRAYRQASRGKKYEAAPEKVINVLLNRRKAYAAQ